MTIEEWLIQFEDGAAKRHTWEVHADGQLRTFLQGHCPLQADHIHRFGFYVYPGIIRLAEAYEDLPDENALTDTTVRQIVQAADDYQGPVVFNEIRYLRQRLLKACGLAIR